MQNAAKLTLFFRVLDHAISGREGAQNAAKFVDILGLRTIFPLFMKTPKKSKVAKKEICVWNYDCLMN